MNWFDELMKLCTERLRDNSDFSENEVAALGVLFSACPKPCEGNINEEISLLKDRIFKLEAGKVFGK